MKNGAGLGLCESHHEQKNNCYIAYTAICLKLRGHAMAWTVEFTGKAQKQYEKLPEKIRLIVAALKLGNLSAISTGVAAFREAQGKRRLLPLPSQDLTSDLYSLLEG
jgi:hypothetical protein